MFKIDDCLAFITRSSSKMFAEVLSARLKQYGINLSQWFSLYYVKNNNSITQKELADLIGITEPSIARLIGSMEAEGYVTRMHSAEDRREKILSLTKKGEATYEKILPVVIKFKDDTTKGIPEKDLVVIRRVLDKMVENCENTQLY